MEKKTQLFIQDLERNFMDQMKNLTLKILINL